MILDCLLLNDSSQFNSIIFFKSASTTLKHRLSWPNQDQNNCGPWKIEATYAIAQENKNQKKRVYLLSFPSLYTNNLGWQNRMSSKNKAEVQKYCSDIIYISIVEELSEEMALTLLKHGLIAVSLKVQTFIRKKITAKNVFVNRI